MKINIKKKLKSAGSTIKGMGSIDKKSLKNGSYSMGITAIVIAVLVVINLIVGQIPEKYPANALISFHNQYSLEHHEK